MSDTPPPVPLLSAANAPVGVSPVTIFTKLRDWFVVIFAPFCVPAVLLAVTRSNQDLAFLRSFTLGDVAFGFVAVAIATVARAIAVKSEEALAFAILALIVVAMQTALAIRVDTVARSDPLIKSIAHLPLDDPARTTTTAAVASDEALRLLRDRPTAVHWGVSWVTGLAFSIISFEVIRREK